MILGDRKTGFKVNHFKPSDIPALSFFMCAVPSTLLSMLLSMLIYHSPQ